MKVVEVGGVGLPARAKPYHVNDETAATETTVVAAAAGKVTQLYGITISTDTAGKYQVKIGSEVVDTFYFGANGGVACPSFYPFYKEGDDANSALTVTKPTAAKMGVSAFVAQV